MIILYISLPEELLMGRKLNMKVPNVPSKRLILYLICFSIKIKTLKRVQKGMVFKTPGSGFNQ